MSRYFLVELTGEFDFSESKDILVEVTDEQGCMEAEKEASIEHNDLWIKKVNSYRVHGEELIDAIRYADDVIYL